MADVPQVGGGRRLNGRRAVSLAPGGTSSGSQKEESVQFLDLLDVRFGGAPGKALADVVLRDSSIETAARKHGLTERTLRRELERLREMYR